MEPTIYVLCRNMKNIRIYLSENFHLLLVKFSVYWNRHVFVMSYMCSVIHFLFLGITKTRLFKYCI